MARLHPRRKVDFRKAQRLGKDDGRFRWAKGSRCVIAEAVARHVCAADLEWVSFKGSFDAPRQYREAIGKARNRDWKGRPSNFRSLNEGPFISCSR